MFHSSPVHSLMLSHRTFCLPLHLPPCTVPCRTVLASPDDRVTCPYHFGSRLSVEIRSSYGPMAFSKSTGKHWHKQASVHREVTVASSPGHSGQAGGGGGGWGRVRGAGEGEGGGGEGRSIQTKTQDGKATLPRLHARAYKRGGERKLIKKKKKNVGQWRLARARIYVKKWRWSAGWSDQFACCSTLRRREKKERQKERKEQERERERKKETEKEERGKISRKKKERKTEKKKTSEKQQ